MSLNAKDILKSSDSQDGVNSTVSTPNKEETPDIRAIMAKIRERVKRFSVESKDERKPFAAMPVDGAKGERRAGEMVHSEELKYLNRHHAFSLQRVSPEKITSHRKFLGPIIVRCKRKLLSLLWDHLLKDYFQAEKEFNSNLVRFLNDFSKYTDSRDASNFWDLIRKIDYDINKALTRIERINDEQMASIRSSERRMYDALGEALNDLNRYITDLVASKAKHEAKLETLQGVTDGLERVINKVTALKSNAGQDSYMAEGVSQAGAANTDYSYVLLENRYRGSEDLIRERLKVYPPLFAGNKLPVLEIGAGRGELQRLFKESKINSYGIEYDRAMAEFAKERGSDVQVGDGIAHLESLADGSLGGVIAIQVIEHLPREKLAKLLKLSREKVAKGGKIIFETINSESMVALTHHYFRDPTHVSPLHPETMRFMLELAGLKVLEIKKLSPFDDAALFSKIEVEDYMTPRWAKTIARLNSNFSRLNDLMYGHQDYCIIAEA